LRDADAIERRDVTLPAWQLLKILQDVRQQGGKLTSSKLATLARGGAKGSYEVSKGKKRQTENLKIDLDTVAGGPVDMNKTVSSLRSCLIAALLNTSRHRTLNI
jgi:ATP-dependent DNA helicase Q1